MVNCSIEIFQITFVTVSVTINILRDTHWFNSIGYCF